MTKNCDICNEPIAASNSTGVCSRTAACRAEGARRWRDRPGNREKDRAWARRWGEMNRERVRERNKGYSTAWARTHRSRVAETVRNSRLRKQFGLTPEQFGAMVAAQGGLCAICHQPETRVQNGRVQSLSVDHDHATGRVRALLCNDCNRVLHRRLTPQRLLDMAGYLKKFQSDNVIPITKGAS